MAELFWGMLRGGSWFHEPHYCRAAFRGGTLPGGHSADVGFRVVCLAPCRTHAIPLEDPHG